MMIPGLIMVTLFVAYIIIVCTLRPEMGPRADDDDMRLPLSAKLKITAGALLPTMALIVAVLGSLIAGIASPTEAAALGAAGALILCIVYGQFSIAVMRESLAITVRISAMILLIVAAGMMFTGIFAANGGARVIQTMTSNLGLGVAGTLVIFLLIVFVLGFVLDWTANVLICVPLFTPFIIAAGIDPIWFATLVIIVIQTGYLTPPMASSIFYLLSIAPPDMKYSQICRGVVPFILIQVVTLAIVAFFPLTATWLPGKIVGF